MCPRTDIGVITSVLSKAAALSWQTTHRRSHPLWREIPSLTSIHYITTLWSESSWFDNVISWVPQNFKSVRVTSVSYWFSSVCAYEQFTFEWLGHSLELNNSWSKCHKHVLSSWSLSVLCILRHTTSASLLGCAPLTSHWNDMHVYFSVMEKFNNYYFRQGGYGYFSICLFDWLVGMSAG